jgi:hypothetical protein
MPTSTVEFKVEVRAATDKLWDILSDVNSWPRWQGTDFVRSSEPGPVREGSKFVAALGGLKWNLRVVKAMRPDKILWVGRRFGLKAIHEWELEEIEGKTTVTTRESMTG